MDGHDQYVSDSRKKILLTARDMIAGVVSYIEGARKINELGPEAELERDDVDFVPFLLIDSETDNLPIGEARRLWKAEVLAQLQPEIDRAEQWARDLATIHCQNLINRFG
jgi:hypothetical protein